MYQRIRGKCVNLLYQYVQNPREWRRECLGLPGSIRESFTEEVISLLCLDHKQGPRLLKILHYLFSSAQRRIPRKCWRNPWFNIICCNDPWESGAEVGRIAWWGKAMSRRGCCHATWLWLLPWGCIVSIHSLLPSFIDQLCVRHWFNTVECKDSWLTALPLTKLRIELGDRDVSIWLGQCDVKRALT